MSEMLNGHLPTVFASLDPRHYLAAYVHIYLVDALKGLPELMGH